MVRAAALAVTLVAVLLVAGLVLEDPGLLAAAWAKVTEGGMWTGLAAFVAAALVLGLRRRGAAGPPSRRR